MTQHQLIKRYIEDFGSITPMQAFSDLGITKLSTRICEMERKGYKVDRKMIESENRWGEQVKYMQYSKVKEKTKEIVYQASRKIEVIEESEYKGVKYAILNLGTHPTAYVENIVNAKDNNDEKLDNVEVHGGFTYCDVKYWSDKSGNYLGWDYAHCYDFCGYYKEDDDALYRLKRWTYEEILLEVHYVIKQLLKLKEKEND